MKWTNHELDVWRTERRHKMQLGDHEQWPTPTVNDWLLAGALLAAVMAGSVYVFGSIAGMW